MAKDKDNSEKNKDGGVGSKIATFFIIILIVFVWFATLAMLIKFDVGGLGTFARDYIEDVPYLNLILPELSDEEIAYREQYPYKNIEEANEYIKELEELVDKYVEENNDYASRQAELQSEVDSLKHFEEEYETYLKQREEFDNEIVFNDKAPTAAEYIEWFETMYPENASRIYEQLKSEQEANEVVQTIANDLAKMKAKDAATILEEYTSDVDFVCEILDCLKTQQVSDILTQFAKDDSLFAARVVYRMKQRSGEE